MQTSLSSFLSLKTVKCNHCGRVYTGDEFNALELTGHNIIWDFDYRRCADCGEEITPLRLRYVGE